MLSDKRIEEMARNCYLRVVAKDGFLYDEYLMECVADTLRGGITEAVAAEREACARAAEDALHRNLGQYEFVKLCEVAAAIRGRGEVKE